MIDRPEPPVDTGLPPDLAELDRELAGIRIEERASFGVELASELVAERARLEARRPGGGATRRLVAAGLAALLLGTLAVPPARGALTRFLTRVQVEATEALRLSPDALPVPEIEMEEPVLGSPERFSDTNAVVQPPPRLVRLGVEPGASTAAAITFPELQNRARVEELVESLYPAELQADGIGGVVRLLLWVDSAGRVEETRIGDSSGVAALDRAAVATAPYLEFEPARRFGRPVGSWLQFDVRFEASLPGDDARLPAVTPVDQPAAPSVRELDVIPEWLTAGASGAALAEEMAQVDLLREAMGDDRAVEERWGSLEGLLSGEAPESEMPLTWRHEAAEALDDAIRRDPDNPAPFLALGRIRRRQGLRVDARRLFERGIDRAENSGVPVPPSVVADLYFEHGQILAEEWLPWMNLGQIHRMAVGAGRCEKASASEPGGTYASAGVLIAWNYLCPSQFDALLQDRLEDLEALKHAVRDEMIRSYLAAVELNPGHLEANVELLLDMVDVGAFEEALDGAQRFALASGGDPNALLLTGLALHRLGRSGEAETQFSLALQRLSGEEVGALRDIAPLLGRAGRGASGPMAAVGRAEMERRFWAPLDPLLATPVNEREIEHLARATYAYLRLGGPATDAGRVFIRYGRPDRIRTFRNGAGLRTVFWDYGPGPDVTFLRPAASWSLELTPEGRAYVEELMDVFPHRYDTGRGRTLPVVSQLARFRDDERGSVEVELHARIPGELATGARDSLEIGLYLTGPAGERWVVTRRRLPAEPAAIHLSAVPTATSDRLVLEVFHPKSNRAARLEMPVSRDVDAAGTPAISDLLLVEPVSPFSPADASRSSSMIEATTSPDISQGELGGIVFELYGLTNDEATYRLSAEAESLESGTLQTVPLKPAGELEFREEWRRVRRNGAVMSEYATADLSGLDRGSYLLRVRAALGGAGVLLETSRAIDVR
jgi:TonB family protein